MMRVMDKLKGKKRGDRGDSSRSRSTRGSGGGDTSSMLFQGSTASRQRLEQLLGCMEEQGAKWQAIVHLGKSARWQAIVHLGKSARWQAIVHLGKSARWHATMHLSQSVRR
ncbi:uncharacterized protein [Zea mays]|uniref:uncharacterized protein n=1 Tax=Zea mays TaxID=4577 RepID=UPI0009A9D7CB|nr:uncharacterized protein LOC103630706 [Zea mays]|eukprot:XP_020394818.1 uncharacterized protein LOC103630706 [Zea mays]